MVGGRYHTDVKAILSRHISLVWWEYTHRPACGVWKLVNCDESYPIQCSQLRRLQLGSHRPTIFAPRAYG